MKKVLIALDYNPSAKIVAEKGYALAKAMNSEVILLHVIADATYYSSLEYSPIMGFAGYSNASFSQIVHSGGLEKASQYFLDQFKLHLGDTAIRTYVEKGDFAEIILKTAKNQHAELIVMGSHSRRWLEQILLGSVTEKVLQQTKTPLFIIPIKEPNS